ncbi:unnamed protein product [Ostreobium quekettii]|uniref:Uncharacterized protein n=1 Tax=Ostreobium quekettii TaxID=121088 RepID=A0A8S1J569_9CHLO|nr:unnamed protein product [Ostreobium quekettii]|eukprot:evm.model.scf_122.9 EVM.evm.TU.scf_122.9   scf_122:50485-61608(+)
MSGESEDGDAANSAGYSPECSSGSEDSSTDDSCSVECLRDQTNNGSNRPANLKQNGKALETGDCAEGACGNDTLTSESLRQQNIDALLANSLVTCRKPLLPKLLAVQEGETQLRRAFKSPHPAAPSRSEDLRRKLLARRRFVPWGCKAPLPQPVIVVPATPPLRDERCESLEDDAQQIEQLVLWAPQDGEDDLTITVDSRLTKFLRPHQREGVQFMFDCVAGLKDFGGQGCILADDMGLGKTLQGISLMWTLLKQGAKCLGGTPMASRVIIVCPTSLVANWDSECQKWLKGAVRTMPMSESTREDVIQGINQFLSRQKPYQVLIISYETFRIHSSRFHGPEACDLLICDEAHRLKNDNTLTNKALGTLQCTRRVLLSGTPMQNHLDEFYAMVNFCNPGVLGTRSSFKRHYELPILKGREPDADEEELNLGLERSSELSTIVNKFILRRTNKLLSEHLPPKVVEVVCCRLSPLQQSMYARFLESTTTKRLLNGKSARVLSAITSLKKLCNHPKLIQDAMKDENGDIEGLESCASLLPEGMGSRGRASRSSLPEGWEELSGKMGLLARMLDFLHRGTSDRIVVVSNYTQTLDLIAALCRDRKYPHLRLDGSTSIAKRQKLVKRFNDPLDRQFVFLLSSKAGGCGLNLVGGNRLVLFDPDWNPATDKQAAARVWRDGQKKMVYVYRFLSTGTIEEKVFQRQLSKEGLQGVVGKSGQAEASMMSAEELRNLFSLNLNTVSDTYDSLCQADKPEPQEEGTSLDDDPMGVAKKQVGKPAEDDLRNWGQHSSAQTVPDNVLRQAAGDVVSFVFTCEVAGKSLELSNDGEETLAVEPMARRSAPAPQKSSTGQNTRDGLRESSPAAGLGKRMNSMTMRLSTPQGVGPVSVFTDRRVLADRNQPSATNTELAVLESSKRQRVTPKHCPTIVIDSSSGDDFE